MVRASRESPPVSATAAARDPHQPLLGAVGLWGPALEGGCPAWAQLLALLTWEGGFGRGSRPLSHAGPPMFMSFRLCGRKAALDTGGGDAGPLELLPRAPG